MFKRALVPVAVAVVALPLAANADPSRDAIAASAGTVLLQVHAVGAQIYVCTTDGHGGLAWSFREPIATLIDHGETVGRHFAGPTWEAADGSSLTGTVVGKAAGMTPDDIPWLRLTAADHRGQGRLAEVTGVRRIATIGGNKSGPCQAEGAMIAVPYAADYVFSK